MINLVKIGLWGMFINYYPFNIMFGHLIPGGTYIFFSMIVIGLLGSALKGVNIDTTIKSWILYAALSLATSVFAISTSYTIKTLVGFGIKIIVTFAVAYVCEREGSVKFAIRLLAGLAILSAVTAFIHMGDISGRLQLDSGASLSVNDFGALMAYGCFAVILLFKYSSIESRVVSMILTAAFSVLFIIELFISGSRKSFYAIIILYAMLLIFTVLKKKKNSSISALIIGFFIMIAIYFIYTNYLEQYVMDTSLYLRVFGRKVEDAAISDDGRIELYKMAWADFKSRPFFGIGLGNFEYIHGLYTHSTYAEPIACSGILSLLYLVPIFGILRNQLKFAFSKINSYSVKYFNMELLIFYFIFLFIGVGIPYLYKEIPCICFGMMIGWQQIYMSKLKIGEKKWEIK